MKWRPTLPLADLLILASLIGFFFYSLNIDSWKYIFVGDDWDFYFFAKDIAIKNFLVNPLSMTGVFGEHRVLGSIWQAIFIKLFWHQPVLGWKISNAFLVFPISFFLYFWVKRLFQTKIAVYCTLFLFGSFYLANFFKIGYLNPQALVCLVASLYFATRAGQSQKWIDFLYLSLSLGISFYIYIGPLFPLIVWPCLFLNFRRPILPNLLNFSCLAVPYLIIIVLGPLLSSHSWLIVFQKTIIKREFTDNIQILVNVYHNFLLFYRNFDYCYNHFVTGPYLDFISRVFCLLGTIVALIKFKTPSHRLVLILYVLTAVIIGISSPYAYAPTTRGIFFLPFGFIFAAIGVNYIFSRRHPLFVSIIFILVFGLNFYLSQTWVFTQTGYSKEALIMRQLMIANTNHENLKIVTLDPNFNYENILSMQNELNLNQSRLSFAIGPNFDCANQDGEKIMAFDQIDCPGLTENQFISVKDKYY